jgi:hypothetical protein
MTATQATIRLYADSGITVEPFIRLTRSTHIHCCTYDDQAPILSLDDEHVRVSLTVPDTHQVTGQDVEQGRRLAEAVARYVAELEKRAATGKDAAGADEAA